MSMKLIKLGKTITVITNKGIIVNNDCSEELFQKVLALVNNDDEEGVRQLLTPELCAEEKKYEIKVNLINNIHSLANIYPGLFSIRDGALYRVGIELSIPEEVAIKYVEAAQDQDLANSSKFMAIDNFWMWASLNPNAESREDLFKFLAIHGMPITEQGMFLAYRRVVNKNSGNKELVNFVSNQYIKVKATWKKSPKSYYVYEKNNSFELIHEDNLENIVAPDDYTYKYKGILEQLYLDLPNLTQDQFTDAHTRTMDYRIGVEARIPRHQGNQSNQVSCSKGLHVASKAYDYSGFGDTAIVVAVNPMDVLAVPVGEDGKLRTCAFTPVAVLNEGEENQILESGDYSELLFDHYHQQVENLSEMLDSNTPYELTVNNILNAVSYNQVDAILSRLYAAEQVLANRVKTI